MNYTNWILQLLCIIIADSDLEAHEIAFTEDELKEYHAKGIAPTTVYNDIWQKDAGNYYKINF